jgi:hypothetical protein
MAYLQHQATQMTFPYPRFPRFFSRTFHTFLFTPLSSPPFLPLSPHSLLSPLLQLPILISTPTVPIHRHLTPPLLLSSPPRNKTPAAGSSSYATGSSQLCSVLRVTYCSSKTLSRTRIQTTLSVHNSLPHMPSSLKVLLSSISSPPQTHSSRTVTLSLNTSLHTHAQTLALLVLQRATLNLPFQLVSPGRMLLRRGPLVQVERAAQPSEREFLLFSDCLVWLANTNAVSGLGWGATYGTGNGTNTNTPTSVNSNTIAIADVSSQSPKAPVKIMRIRSKSEAELSMLKERAGDTTPTLTPGATSPSPSTPSSPSKRTHVHAHAHKRYSLHPPAPAPPRRHPSNGDGVGTEERWIYKGRAELVDLEIIVSPDVGGEGYSEGWERRFEVLSPEGSFVVYAGEFLLLFRFSFLVSGSLDFAVCL